MPQILYKFPDKRKVRYTHFKVKKWIGNPHLRNFVLSDRSVTSIRIKFSDLEHPISIPYFLLDDSMSIKNFIN